MVVMVVVIVIRVAVAVVVIIDPGKGSGENLEKFFVRREGRFPLGFLIRDKVCVGVTGTLINILLV